MRRIRAFLFLAIMVFSLVSGPTVVLARLDPSHDGMVPSTSTTSPNDPSTFNIPRANPLSQSDQHITGGLALPDQSREGIGFLANNVTDFLISFINAIVGVFGLHSIDQLAVSTKDNFWGALSVTDMKVVSPFVITFSVIAWMVAGVSIQIFAMKLAASTMNARRRASVIDYFQNWFVGAIFLAVGPRAINLIFQAASSVIWSMYKFIGERPFNPISGINNMFANDPSFGVGAALGLVAYLLVVTGVTLMLNFIYLQRYVTLFVYAILSPIFMSFYFFDNTRALFWNFIKELIGLAFMPAVHMILIAVYMTIADTAGTSNLLLRLVFLIMFIPLSDMVRKLTSTSGGTSGVAENLLGGMGMGLAMQATRTLSGGAGAVMMGGGLAEAALFGGGMGGGGSPSGAKSSVGGAGGGSNAFGGAAGFFGGGSGGGMSQVMDAVNSSKVSGGKIGGIAGTIAGGLMGAGTGNMAGIMMGGSIGQRAGSNAGSSVAGGIAAEREMHNATHALDEKGNDAFAGLSGDQRDLLQQQRNEEVFGPGADAPSDMSSGMRQSITARNMSMVRGDTEYASDLNSQINSSLGSMREAAMSAGVQSGDNLTSMGYSDHTDYYKSNADGSQDWLYSSQAGDKNAGAGTAVRSQFTVVDDGKFKESSRAKVSVGDISPSKTGLPQGWNN